MHPLSVINNYMNNNKVIVILGPTASGKSDVAIWLAKKFGGEVVSADSRQIYRGMDIGSGKVPKDTSCKLQVTSYKKITNSKNQKSKTRQNKKLLPYYSGGIPHYMLDIVSPNTDYSVAKFKKDAQKIIKDILKRGKVPIICGGTGFWIKSIVDDIDFPEVKPDWQLRNQLQDKSAKELFKKLQKLDPERAKNIDPKNKVRLIRAIEICKKIGTVPKLKYCHPELTSRSTKKMLKQIQHDKKYEFLQIGIDWPKEKLNERIRKNVEKRFTNGMIREVQDLHKTYKISWNKIQSFGLSYYLIPEYLKGNINSEEELKEKIYLAEKKLRQTPKNLV